MDSEKLKEYQEILAKDTSKVPEFWINKYKTEAAKNWDKFYQRNTTNFFKDRHWIDKEFDDFTNSIKDESSKPIAFEMGCGVGNFIYPVLRDHPKLFMHACDFSKRAIEFVKEHEDYNPERCHPFVCDLTQDDLTQHIEPNSVDIASAIFVFSAIPPEKMSQTVQNIAKIMKPGGIIIFRDYAKYDAAQLRFKSGSKLEENLYVRQDGTMAYYFDQAELFNLFSDNGFNPISIDPIYKETINRKQELHMHRIFLQAKFVKRA